jgi:hypothetical protein
MARPALWAVEMPQDLVSHSAELGDLLSRVGLGTDRMPWPDLNGPAIAAAAERSPDAELLAQHVVLTWLQVQDHEDHNFMQDGEHVVAIDFATGPPDAVWEGLSALGEERRDHGRLGDRLQRVPAGVRESTRVAVDALGASVLDDILGDMPGEWALPEERHRIRDELLRTKEALVRDLLS